MTYKCCEYCIARKECDMYKALKILEKLVPNLVWNMQFCKDEGQGVKIDIDY